MENKEMIKQLQNLSKFEGMGDIWILPLDKEALDQAIPMIQNEIRRINLKKEWIKLRENAKKNGIKKWEDFFEIKIDALDDCEIKGIISYE